MLRQMARRDMTRRLGVDMKSRESLVFGFWVWGFFKMLEIIAYLYIDGNDSGRRQKLMQERQGRIAGDVVPLS